MENYTSTMAILQILGAITLLSLGAYYFILELKKDWHLIVGKKAKNGSRLYRSLPSGNNVSKK